MTNCNAEIRTAAKNAGVYLYQIAAEIGVSEPTMTRKMRYEMGENEKKTILSIIDRLRSDRSEDNA